MKKLLFVLIMGVSTLSLSAQQKTLSLVMKYTWTMDAKTYKVLSEGKCQDGFEFDFVNKKAHYYTPDAEIAETLCKIIKVSNPITNPDQSTSSEFKLHMVGPEKDVDCILNVSKDLRSIKFTMISDGKAIVYKVTNMLTDDQL